MKRIIFAIAALFCTTLSFAQEYMIIENNAGGWTSIDVSVISQAYFKEFPTSGEGTKENPFNVAAANAKCKEIGTEPSVEKYYVKGIVVSTGNNSDGPAAYIADDNSGINRLYIYKIAVPEGITLNRNDEVVLYGVLYHYRNLTTEMEAELVAINGQTINGDDVETVPISNVLAGEDGVTYSVRGEVTKIANTKYGNFYIKDETGEIYIYGTQDANGSWNFANLGIEVGDIVTVMGPKTTYNGTVELVNVRVLKIEKPVIEPKGSGTLADPYNVQAVLNYIETLGADTPSEQDVYIKGYVTNITSQFTSSYGNATFTISDTRAGANSFLVYRALFLENKKWEEGNATLNEGDEVIVCGKVINYKGITPETAQNTAYLYSLNGKTKAENGGGTPSDEVKVVSIAQFKAAEVSADVWYQLTGIVCNLKDGDLYGNFDLMDATDSVYVYGLLSEKGGAKKLFQELVAAKGIKNGSKITIIGTRGEYNGKIEVLNAYFVSIEGEGGGGNTETTGTLAKPFTPTEANEFVSKMEAGASTDKDYYIKGKLVKYANKGEFGTQYGNSSFYISVDGKEDSEQFYVYRTYYLGNVKYSDNSWLKPQVGDEVIICGKLTSYNGTPETVANQSYIYSLNGKTEIESGGSTPTPSDEAKAVTIAQFNIAAESTEVWYQLTGTISNLKDGDLYGNFDLTDETGSVYVYGLLSEKGGAKKKFQELVAAKGIANGSKITIIGNRGSYGGKIEVLNAYFDSIEGEGGGEQGGGGVNANKNISGPAEAQYRYEFPKLKGGNNVVVVHKSILNKDTNEEGVNYCVEWNPSICAQRWSCYQLYSSVNYGSGNVTRYSANNDGSLSPECQYPNDPDLPVEYQFTVDSYKGSGYDHGHICPSADRLRATECNYQTFFITNMQPQNNNFNAGIWADMEAQVRAWAKNYDTLYVCKGGTIDNSNYIIKYLGSGNNKIPVPQYFYMAVLGKKGSTYKATGFWIDQNNHPSTSIKDYAVTIQELEEKTNIDFFCNLPDNIENSVETVSKSTMESEWNWPN